MNGFYYALDIIKNQLELDNDVNVVNTGIIEDVLLKKADLYPYSHILVNNATLNGSTWSISYSVICMDIVDISKEQTTDIFRGQNNVQDVLNTQLVVINRLLEVLRRGENTNLYQLDGSPNCEPFEDRFEHGVAGWTVTFDLLIPNDMTVCDNDVTPVKLCPDFEYTITDADSNVLYTGDILSGDTLVQVITNATVTNSLGTVLGSILAQGSLELPDVNNIDSDGSTVPTPAGVAFTCTPSGFCDDATLTLNTNPFLTVASGSNTDISLVDQDDIDITPISVIGSTIKVDIPSGGGTDPDVTNFLTATGITDTTIETAITNLVSDLKTNYFWNRLLAIYPFVGGTATTHKYNLKDPRDLNDAFRITFNGTWTHNANGITGDGTTAYADTNLNGQFNCTVYNECLGVYTRDVIANCLIGASSNPTDQIIQLGGTLYSSLSGGNANGAVSASDGLYTVNRLNTTSCQTYIDGVEVLNLSDTVASYGNQNLNYYIGARNNGGGIDFRSTNNLAFAFIGRSFSALEQVTFYAIIQDFQTTLSRNV